MVNTKKHILPSKKQRQNCSHGLSDGVESLEKIWRMASAMALEVVTLKGTVSGYLVEKQYK